MKMASLSVTILLVFATALAGQNASDAQKKEFIELLKTLPTKGEFYTEDAIRKAGPYLPVLLSLTERDTEKFDLYPFAAISTGLASDKARRAYVLGHFADIRHPQLKLFWAALLFNADDVSPEVVRYLLDAYAVIGPDKRGSSPQKKRRSCLRNSQEDEITFAP